MSQTTVYAVLRPEAIVLSLVIIETAIDSIKMDHHQFDNKMLAKQRDGDAS